MTTLRGEWLALLPLTAGPSGLPLRRCRAILERAVGTAVLDLRTLPPLDQCALHSAPPLGKVDGTWKCKFAPIQISTIGVRIAADRRSIGLTNIARVAGEGDEAQCGNKANDQLLHLFFYLLSRLTVYLNLWVEPTPKTSVYQMGLERPCRRVTVPPAFYFKSKKQMAP